MRAFHAFETRQDWASPRTTWLLANAAAFSDRMTEIIREEKQRLKIKGKEVSLVQNTKVIEVLLLTDDFKYHHFEELGDLVSMEHVRQSFDAYVSHTPDQAP